VVEKAISDNHQDSHWPNTDGNDSVSPALVREELSRILTSRHFRTSRRSKEFLQYVVNQKIKGELIKERLIGVYIFGRKPDYSVGEDPVVRVLAGDVRRRLELYNTDPECSSDILIQIPLGSYAPVFRTRTESHVDHPSAGEVTKSDPTDASSPGMNPKHGEDLHPFNDDDGQGAALPTAESPLASFSNADANEGQSHRQRTESLANSDAVDTRQRRSKRRVTFQRAAIPVVACLIIIGYLISSYSRKSTDPTLKDFWLPAHSPSNTVLLCLPNPVIYKPSAKLFERYEKTHPNSFNTREARQDNYLPLDPTDTIHWGDMIPSYNSGPGMGGVIAAVNMAELLTQQGIRFKLRFGNGATYEEMRDFPTVIVGGIDTSWSPELTSGLAFTFDEAVSTPSIYETKGARRVWKMDVSNGHITRDYGLITRQLSGKTGQFLVQVAGISHFGTEAASEMLLENAKLAKILRSKSISLQKKNIQIVVSTDITGDRAGPPQVVAVSSW